MAIDVDHPFLTFQSGEPVQGGTCIMNAWWTVHPDRGLAVWRGSSPQCNSSESITRELTQRLYPWAVVEFRELAIVKLQEVR